MSDEHKFKETIEEIAREIADKTGLSHIHIRQKLYEIIEKIPEEKRLRVKEYLMRIGTPIAYVMLAEAFTMGTASPMLLYGSGIGGLIEGYMESREVAQKLQELEEKHRKREEKRVEKVI